MHRDLARAERKVRRLGFEPRLSETKQVEPMTRLRLGVFHSRQAAEAALKNVASLAPDAFILRQGGRIVVYAGSYFEHGQARKFEKHLRKAGLHVTEEAARVPMTLTLVRFGRFEDFSSAKQQAGRAAKVGLETYVRRIE